MKPTIFSELHAELLMHGRRLAAESYVQDYASMSLEDIKTNLMKTLNGYKKDRRRMEAEMSSKGLSANTVNPAYAHSHKHEYAHYKDLDRGIGQMRE